MQFLVEEVIEFTTAVWGSVLDPGITHLPEVPDPDAAGPTLTSWVQISGGWTGAVVLSLGVDVARIAAGLMLDAEPGDVAEDDLIDVVGELANMIGGNVKALVPEPSQLGLPNVVEGKSYSMHLPGSQEVSRVGFEWRGAPVVVLIMQSQATPGEN